MTPVRAYRLSAASVPAVYVATGSTRCQATSRIRSSVVRCTESALAQPPLGNQEKGSPSVKGGDGPGRKWEAEQQTVHRRHGVDRASLPDHQTGRRAARQSRTRGHAHEREAHRGSPSTGRRGTGLRSVRDAEVERRRVSASNERTACRGTALPIDSTRRVGEHSLVRAPPPSMPPQPPPVARRVAYVPAKRLDGVDLRSRCRLSLVAVGGTCAAYVSERAASRHVGSGSSKRHRVPHHRVQVVRASLSRAPLRPFSARRRSRRRPSGSARGPLRGRATRVAGIRFVERELLAKIRSLVSCAVLGLCPTGSFAAPGRPGARFRTTKTTSEMRKNVGTSSATRVTR